MKDTQLYEHEQILGLQAPWKVQSVQLNQEAGEIEVQVRCEQTRWTGEGGQRLQGYGYEQRRWRHLDSCQYRRYLKVKVPRVKYPDGRTELVRVPWAEKNSRFTMLIERLAIDLLLECSVKAACTILRLSGDASDGIKQRALRGGLQRRQERALRLKGLCIDEKSNGKGHKYLTLVAQIQAGRSATATYIAEGRDEAAPEALKGKNLKTARAWAIKEKFRSFWKCASHEEASRFFSSWYGWASRSRLGPLKRAAKMLKKHLRQIHSYFRHRLTNAAIEGLKNKNQAIVKKAYGHRNLQRYKNDILFHVGGLHLYPEW